MEDEKAQKGTNKNKACRVRRRGNVRHFGKLEERKEDGGSKLNRGKSTRERDVSILRRHFFSAIDHVII